MTPETNYRVTISRCCSSMANNPLLVVNNLLGIKAHVNFFKRIIRENIHEVLPSNMHFEVNKRRLPDLSSVARFIESPRFITYKHDSQLFRVYYPQMSTFYTSFYLSCTQPASPNILKKLKLGVAITTFCYYYYYH